MKLKKLLLCLSVAMFFTQLAAKDLAKEKEMLCYARSYLSWELLSTMQKEDNHDNELQQIMVAKIGGAWRDRAKNKFIGKLKVSKDAFDGAFDKVLNEEKSNLISYLSEKNLSDNPPEMRATGLKYRMRRMEELGCHKDY